MLHRTSLSVLLTATSACSGGGPAVAPTSIVQPIVTPNAPPQIVTASVTPARGVIQLTTFTARLEVRDPDGDRVEVKVRGCGLDDEAVALTNGVGNVSFKPAVSCSLTVTATDNRGATARAFPSVGGFGLSGPFQLRIGTHGVGKPRVDSGTFHVDLIQAGATVAGTIWDYGDHRGITDPAEPGQIDAEGRFRIRFKLEGDFTLAGQLTWAHGSLFENVTVASGVVTGARYAGKTFSLVAEAQY